MTDFSTLEPLTRAQTITLRGTVENVCAARGLPYAPHDHDAYRIGDAICGLANLAALVANHPEDQWHGEVDAWIANMERLREARDSDVTNANIYPRLIRNTTPADADTGYPRAEVLPGLSLIFAADYPTHVAELRDTALFGHLGGVDKVGRIAVDNLHRLPVPAPDLVDLEIDGSDAPVIAFEFEDFFAPSRLLNVGTFAAEHLPAAEHGFLVAAPTRDVLLFLLVDADNVLGQVNVFASTVDNLYRSGPGSTCKLTYHLAPSGGLDLVAYLSAPDSLYFRPNEYLSARLFARPESQA